MSVRLLFLTAETCPTFRPDVHVLFGKYLPRHGVHSDIVAGRALDVAGPVVWGGGDAYLCDTRGGVVRRQFCGLFHGIRALLGRAVRSRYDAIQVRDLPVLAAVALVIARARRLRMFYWMSFPIPEYHIEVARKRGLSAGLLMFLFPWLNGWLERLLLYHFVLRGADHVFVQSDRMKEDMTTRGLEPERMTVVPMGVDMEEIRAGEIRPSDDRRLQGRRVLVYLGTLDRPRRIEILFRMLVLLRERVPAALLVLVGDTGDRVHRGWLLRQAETAGVADAVVWTGWLPTLDAWRYVKAAEVGISPVPRGPLLDVGSPTKVPEYLALGIPVLCNDNPDQAKVIGDSGAGMCVPYRAETFAEAALAMLDATASWRDKARSAGADYVDAHRSYERISMKVAEVYRQWH